MIKDSVLNVSDFDPREETQSVKCIFEWKGNNGMLRDILALKIERVRYPHTTPLESLVYVKGEPARKAGTGDKFIDWVCGISNDFPFFKDMPEIPKVDLRNLKERRNDND